MKKINLLLLIMLIQPVIGFTQKTISVKKNKCRVMVDDFNPTFAIINGIEHPLGTYQTKKQVDFTDGYIQFYLEENCNYFITNVGLLQKIRGKGQSEIINERLNEYAISLNKNDEFTIVCHTYTLKGEFIKKKNTIIIFDNDGKKVKFKKTNE